MRRPVLISRLLAIVWLACLLGACGWQLRGSAAASLADVIPAVDLELEPLANTLEVDIGRALEARGVEVSAGAAAVLRVDDEHFARRVGAVAITSRAAEYHLEYGFRYQLIVDGKQVRARELDITRSQVFDPAQLDAMSQEEDLMRAEMRRELIERMLTELARTAR